MHKYINHKKATSIHTSVNIYHTNQVNHMNHSRFSQSQLRPSWPKWKKMPLKSKLIFYTSLFRLNPPNNQGGGQQIAGIIQAATHKDSQAWQGMGISAEKLNVWCFVWHYLSSSKIPLEGTPYIFLLPTSQELTNKSGVGKEECAGVLKKIRGIKKRPKLNKWSAFWVLESQVVCLLGHENLTKINMNNKTKKNWSLYSRACRSSSNIWRFSCHFAAEVLRNPAMLPGPRKARAKTLPGTTGFHPNWPGFPDLPAKLWTTWTFNL